jgi:enoyl-CoA hydratase/carnithine racemase
MTVRVDDPSPHVRLLTIDRPERKNAFDQRTYHALADSLTAAAANALIHVVVVTGSGNIFSAGQDLQEMAGMAKGEIKGANGFTALLVALEEFAKPLIAAVNGAAVGIGATMLLHCDLVYVSTAARLRLPFAEMGVPPEAGASALLVDRVGWQMAADLLFSARWIDPVEAVALGLARATAAPDELLDTALAMAAEIASKSPFAVQTAKSLMLAARGDRSQLARVRENSAFAELFSRQRNSASE